MAAVSETPAKQDLPPQKDDMPIMSTPPKDYAPPVKDEGGARKITPLRKLQREQQGPEPEWVKCQFCKKATTIRRVSEPSDEAKCLTLCCCVFGVFSLFLPFQSKWFENIDIHCASCDKHLATIVPDGEVQIVRVPNRPQPTLKK
ncbi:hypothetical protein O1611_g7324 [Lasiodiplodia mahajangana]|uniref:Uncharacterized protein n=1 Tax=Lasiodiplodia mahajangana TaxID=1108764 RepID=A0ACC2JFR4_9PEZI|nr:hypothetical protein O1611_g7324 [Lasiodiplodia mahajangana]